MTNRYKTFVRKDFAELTREKCHYFSNDELNKVPTDHGVYIIYAPRTKNVVHVGRTYTGKRGLQQRLKNHVHGQSSFANEYLKGDGEKLRHGYSFRYLPLPKRSWRRRAFLELYAAGSLCPAHIGKHLRRDLPQSK